MKKTLQILILLCLAVLTVTFGFLWRKEKNSKEDLRLLAQSGAEEAYTSFLEFQKGGGEADYWKGVAAFRSFEQAFYLLTEDTNLNHNYIYCNDVYGALVLHPDRCRDHMGDIVATMGILRVNVEDTNGYLKMFELGNILRYE